MPTTTAVDALWSARQIRASAEAVLREVERLNAHLGSTGEPLKLTAGSLLDQSREAARLARQVQHLVEVEMIGRESTLS